jgi:hypothetical protein
VDLAIPKTRLDILWAFVVEEGLQESAALVGDAFNVIYSEDFPFGGLLPEKLADE